MLLGRKALLQRGRAPFSTYSWGESIRSIVYTFGPRSRLGMLLSANTQIVAPSGKKRKDRSDSLAFPPVNGIDNPSKRIADFLARLNAFRISGCGFIRGRSASKAVHLRARRACRPRNRPGLRPRSHTQRGHSRACSRLVAPFWPPRTMEMVSADLCVLRVLRGLTSVHQLGGCPRVLTTSHRLPFCFKPF